MLGPKKKLEGRSGGGGETGKYNAFENASVYSTYRCMWVYDMLIIHVHDVYKCNNVTFSRKSLALHK